jgi:MerR family transcriptional regulator, light-induced transcriptional regulator
MDEAQKGYADENTDPSNQGSPSENNNQNHLLPLVEVEIIPRLMQAHSQRESKNANEAKLLPADEVVAFTQAILLQDSSVANEQIAKLRSHGLTVDAVYLYLLSPAARYLGELWESDACSFTEVTLGMWRIQQIMYDLSPVFHANRKPLVTPGKQRRILIATLPGSQHSFGLSMLSEFFRSEGWTVLAIPAPDQRELLEALVNNWLDVFALSISLDSELDNAKNIIEFARKRSCNPEISVIAGGPLCINNPELVESVGADGTSMDAPGALKLATQLLKQQHQVSFN